MKHKKKKNDFTLVELITTITIITVIFRIASITVINLISNSKEKSETIVKNNILNASKIYAEEYNNNIYWKKTLLKIKKKKSVAYQ